MTIAVNPWAARLRKNRPPQRSSSNRRIHLRSIHLPEPLTPPLPPPLTPSYPCPFALIA